MRTIFHVGHSKTGSTAVQTALGASRKALIARGVLFPRDPYGLYDNNHKLLFADIFSSDQVPRHIRRNFSHAGLPAARDETVRSIRREIAEHRPDGLVLSSESRFREWTDDQRGRFRDTMAALGAIDPEFVVYVRRPSSWYLSILQQWLHASHDIKKPRALHALARVEQLAEDFGRERVTLRPYDRRRLKDGDVVADFVASCLSPHGVEPGDLPRAREANASFAAEIFDLMRRYRLEFHPHQNDQYLPESKVLISALRKIQATLPLPRPAMDPDLAERIDYSFDDLLRLRDGFGLELPDYDYARLERGELTALPERPLELHEIVRIDRAAQARVVERLRESAWAEADPARRRWLDALPGRIEAEGREGRRPEGAAGRGAVASGTARIDGPPTRAEERGSFGLPDLPPMPPLRPGEPVLCLGGALAARIGPALRRVGLGPAMEEPPVAMPTATLLARWSAWAARAEGPEEPPREGQGRLVEGPRPAAAPFAAAADGRAPSRPAVRALADAAAQARAALIDLETARAWLDAEGREVLGPTGARAERQPVADVAAALREAVGSLRGLNPALRVILLMRPAPPPDDAAGWSERIAAAEDDAIRRAALSEVVASVADIEYLPLFEALVARRGDAQPERNGAGMDEPDLLAEAVVATMAASSAQGAARRRALGG